MRPSAARVESLETRRLLAATTVVETEPNDISVQAVNVNVSGNVKLIGRCGGSNVDWFKLTAAALVTIAIVRTPNDFAGSVDLRDLSDQPATTTTLQPGQAVYLKLSAKKRFTNYAVEVDPAPVAPSWSNVKSAAYHLQNIGPAAVAASKYDMVVIDASRDGSDGGRFTKDEVTQMKGADAATAKRVVAYISLGEAENYRGYWQKSWNKAKNRPAWIGPENPDWPGNFKVRYWDDAWQAIVKQQIDAMIDRGYDGVFFDVVDGYEFWQPDRPQAGTEMANLVASLSTYAKQKSGNTDFGIFANGGEALWSQPGYMNALTGQAKEDVWYDDNAKVPVADTREVVKTLRRFKDAGKLVFVIDYPTVQSKIDDFYLKCETTGFLPYASDRDLDRLQVNPGHEPK
ncbi:MAG: endo alpha-1,4 polygalactosaminidase [Tepidisphaeraceae bacterium]